MNHRPSVVAIAAVLLACDGQLTRNTLECKIGVVASLHSLEKASFFHFYNLFFYIYIFSHINSSWFNLTFWSLFTSRNVYMIATILWRSLRLKRTTLLILALWIWWEIIGTILPTLVSRGSLHTTVLNKNADCKRLAGGRSSILFR